MPAKKTGSDVKNKSVDDSGEEYYVGISEPLEVRRTILETSKSIIQAMHRYEKYKEFRAQKLELLNKLNKQTNELSGLVGSLKARLPKSSLRVKKAREEIQAKKKKGNYVKPSIDKATPKIEKKVVEKPVPKKEMTELEKLEIELSDIESKLSGLNK